MKKNNNTFVICGPIFCIYRLCYLVLVQNLKHSSKSASPLQNQVNVLFTNFYHILYHFVSGGIILARLITV